MTHIFSTRVAAIGVTLVLAFGLTACGDDDTPTTLPASGSSDASGETSLDGFPSDVPIIDGTVVHASHPGNIWAVWVASDDLAGDMAKATQLLVDAGFENVIVTDEYRDFHGTEYQVHVTAKDDPNYGSTIAYSYYPVQ